MRLLLALAGYLAAGAHAGSLSVSVSRYNDYERLHHLAERSGDISLEAFNNLTGGGYYADFEIGSPGQKLSFQLDTGSSDTWANSANADFCNNPSQEAQYGYCTAQFQPENSSTFKMVSQGGFNISYLDGRNIMGDYFNDTVTINGEKVQNQQLGLALTTVRPSGIMGLGLDTGEAAVKIYPTILDNMVSQGLINTRAFSLYLNDLDTSTGTVLFGAVDSQKFIGQMATLPMLTAAQISQNQSLSSNITFYSAKLQGFTVNVPSGADAVTIPAVSATAVFDSGSTICLLPDSVAQALFTQFNVGFIEQSSNPYVDCAYAGTKGDGYSFEFQFNGKSIRVPMSEMIIDALPKQDQNLIQTYGGSKFTDWAGVCLFGADSVATFGIRTSTFVILADTFLRSAYVVYDLENSQIGLAQANLNSTTSDIHEFQAGSSDIPNVTGVQAQQTTVNPSSTSTSSSSTVASTSTVTVTAASTTTSSGKGAAGHLVPPFGSGPISVAAVTIAMMALGAAMSLL